MKFSIPLRVASLPEYVVGFNFVGERPTAMVVLIRKNKPAWQRNKLNGIGGKVEQDETPAQAMVREYAEETGDTECPTWSRFCTQIFDDCVVHFFKAFSPQCSAHTATDEQVIWVPAADIVNNGFVIPNLRWMIPMAMYTDDHGVFFHGH